MLPSFLNPIYPSSSPTHSPERGPTPPLNALWNCDGCGHILKPPTLCQGEGQDPMNYNQRLLKLSELILYHRQYCSRFKWYSPKTPPHLLPEHLQKAQVIRNSLKSFEAEYAPSSRSRLDYLASPTPNRSPSLALHSQFQSSESVSRATDKLFKEGRQHGCIQRSIETEAG